MYLEALLKYVVLLYPHISLNTLSFVFIGIQSYEENYLITHLIII